MIDGTRVIEVVQEHLEAWPLYCSKDEIGVYKNLDDGILAIMYSKDRSNRASTHWSANIIDNVFYILEVRVELQEMFRGYGSSLYAILTDIAIDLGCREIRQTPSGWTPRGETRRSYLNRRGWIDDGDEVVKCLSTRSK